MKTHCGKELKLARAENGRVVKAHCQVCDHVEIAQGLVIEEITAFVGIDNDGSEGVCGMMTADGRWMPLIGADKWAVDSMREVALKIAKATGKKLRMIRFSAREVMEEIG